MNIKGKKPGINSKYIVIPRNGENFVFFASAIISFKEFEDLVKIPVAPQKVFAGSSIPVNDVNDPGYIQQLSNYTEMKIAWIFLKTLSQTQELNWDKVDMKNPNSWKHYKDELQEAGFTQTEINYIMNDVFIVNAMSQEILDQARESFLASLREQDLTQSSRGGVPNVMLSGDHANVSGLNLQM